MILKKIPYTYAEDVLNLYSPEKPILQLLHKDMTPFELIQAAMKEALFSDCMFFLAHALPLREAIWWAACCASENKTWNKEELDAISATKAWVNTPEENTRIHAGKMANAAQLETGAGWAAQAAFWSGGSMLRPEDPVVPPPLYLYAKGVAGSVNLSAVLPIEENAVEKYNAFVDIALDIANGGNGTNGKRKEN